MTIPTSGVSYSQVCGKVLGYPYNSLDSFNPDNKNIEDKYFDGISITYGPAGSRQHISLVGTGHDGTRCPCTASSSLPDSQPDFVGDDYYCKSGASGADYMLWDVEQCDGNEADCCRSWFIYYWWYRVEDFAQSRFWWWKPLSTCLWILCEVKQTVFALN